MAAASAASRCGCSLLVYPSTTPPTVGRPSATSHAMLTRRCSSGAARVSSTPWTTPVNGETNVRRARSAVAGCVACTGSRSTADTGMLLVPGQRRRDRRRIRAGRAAGYPVDVMHAQLERPPELDGVERRRGVVAPENEPLEGDGRGDARDQGNERR